MATITSQRPWEPPKSSPDSSPQPRGQLPSISALTNNLPENGSSGLPSPASTRERDSGAWSSQAHSTRSSGYSTTTSSYPMSSATNSYYMSPNRMSKLSAVSSASAHAQSHASTDYSVPPTSAGPISSPGFAPAHHSSQLPSLNQHHDPNRQSIASQQSQQSHDGFPKQESRRSSIGSQVNQGMNSLQINGATSPYSNSVNHSSTSLAQNLSRERGIHGAVGLRTSRSSAQLPTSPLCEQRPSTGYGRVAPVIGRNPRSDVYNADEPIPGQAYAFPDAPDMEPGALPPKNSSIRHTNSSDGSVKPAFDSRRDSGHTSVASSVNEFRLPPGQHRLEEAAMPGTHHHSLQQHQMSDMQDDEALTPEENSQPYSRTPALRVSHKMAERKRRSEMKDLFENLRSQIPTNQGSKSSKWEILTKASEYIRLLETSNQGAAQADKQLRLAMHDVNQTRRDNDKLRNENQALLAELQRLGGTQAGGPQTPGPQQQPPPPSQSSYPSSYNPPPPPAPPQMHDPGRSLPPLHSTVNSNSMQGVEYR